MILIELVSCVGFPQADERTSKVFIIAIVGGSPFHKACDNKKNRMIKGTKRKVIVDQRAKSVTKEWLWDCRVVFVCESERSRSRSDRVPSAESRDLAEITFRF